MAVKKLKERQKEIALKIFVGAALVLLGIGLTIVPFLTRSSFLRREISLSSERVTLNDDVVLAREKLEKLEGYFLGATERSAVISKISEAANKEKVEIEALSPRTEPGEDYLKLTAEVTARGDFFNLLKFFQNVDSFSPAIKINTVAMKLVQSDLQKEKSKKIKANIVLETYLKQKVRKKRVQ